MASKKISDLWNKYDGIGRKTVREFVKNEIKPGDILDFNGFSLQSNSFADEFVKTFVDIYGYEEFIKLKFLNVPKLLGMLFRKTFNRIKQENKD